MAMLLIKGVEIFDGTGKPSFKGDILIKDNRISAIGDFPNKIAKEVIDGAGMVAAPGFIDVNTSSDHYLTLFTDPAQKNFLLQGVTTIIGGQCGSSLAPLLYGSLESIRKWTDTNQINVDWHSLKEFFAILRRRKFGVNFGTLIGHSTIRRALLKDSLRDLTVPEMETFKELVSTSLEEGALGLSTGLGYSHSSQTPYQELETLAAVVARHKGVYTTHLRDEREGLLAAVTETLRVAERTGVTTIMSHFRPLLGFEKDFSFALDLIAKSDAAPHVYFDNYPFDMSIVPIYTFLPKWAQRGGLEGMRSHLATPYLAERIIEEFPQLKGNDVVVLQAPGAEYLIGTSLGVFAENQGLNIKEGLLKLMKVTSLRAVVSYRNVRLDLAIQSISNPHHLVASNSPGFPHYPSVQDDRASSTFSSFLSLVKQKSLLPMEKAIQTITQTPAKILNLPDRGELRKGAFADIVLLQGHTVVYAILGGEVVVREGQFEEKYAGTLLTRGSS